MTLEPHGRNLEKNGQAVDILPKAHIQPPTLGEVRHRNDEALEVLADTGGVVHHVTEEENARVLKKIDWYLMPILVTIYWLQYMDKQTLSFASIFGIQQDVHLIGEQYSLLGSIVFIAQLVCQPFSAFLLVRLRLSFYVPLIVTGWGATLACMSAAHDFKGLMAARFFLGGFEASIAASFVLVGQIWYRRQEQGFRVAIWYSQNGFVNIFGSLIIYGLGHITSSVLRSYQIIFMVLGIVTTMVGITCFFIFPDNPVKNKFLTKEDKIIAVERIRANQQGLETKVFKMDQAVEMILDLKSWFWMILMFLVSIPAGGISTFGPLILQGFGFDSYTVMLLNIPFGAMQVIAIFGAFWAARAFRMKSPVLLIAMVPCIVGSGMLYGLGRSPKDQPALLVAYYILACYTAVTPIVLNWHSTNVAGHTKKTTTTAFVTMGQVGGNIVGPLLFTTADKPYYRKGVATILACFCIFTGLVCATNGYLYFLNKRNERRRVAAGKRRKITDYSMLTSQEASAAREKEQAQGHGITDVIGMNAFDDLTDLQNDEFIYVY